MRAALLLVAVSLAASGCVTDGAVGLLSSEDAVEIVDEAGAPVPHVAYTLLLGDVAVARGSASALGTLLTPSVRFDRALLSAGGFETLDLSAAELHRSPLVMRAAAAPDFLDARPALAPLPPYEFAPYIFGPEAACAYRNTCGLSEPVIEAASGGVLYASSVCCIGGSPPVWVSRDSGATWQDLETPGVREAVGIEGDIAIDAAGNMYFTDILLGALWLTSWDAEGNWRHSTPVPLAPLVDRPWVRAGAEDVVYFLYNTGRSTELHVSTDGGRTFPPIPAMSFPAALGTLAQGTDLEHLAVVAGMKLYESTDGGATWSEGEDVPTPERDGGGFGFAVPAIDAAGNVAVAFDHGSDDTGSTIEVAIRDAAGAWSLSTASPVSRGGATHVMPWIEAGPAGGFVVAWYGAEGEAKGPEAIAAETPWHVYLAATHDAGVSWQVTRADPVPVLEGPMARRLLDFLQVDLDDAGAAHLVYAHNRDGTNAERTSYLRTTVGLGLAQAAPDAAPAASRNPLLSYVSGALVSS